MTPSYNQTQFLEETIRSVLLQGYPNLEYAIIDGESTDGSLEIIRRYEPWLAYWVSEKDRGQSHAINKGFSRASGEIVAWLNSDDLYAAGALPIIGSYFTRDLSLGMAYGDDRVIDSDGTPIETRRSRDFDLRWLLVWNYIPQPSTFIRRSVVPGSELVDETLHYVMDWDLWIRLARRVSVCRVPYVLSAMRFHPQAKSIEKDFNSEIELLIRRIYLDDLPPVLARMRPWARAMQAYRLGVSYFNSGEQERARRAFWDSLRVNVLGPKTLARLGYLLCCTLPRRPALALRRWAHAARWPPAYRMFHERKQ